MIPRGALDINWRSLASVWSRSWRAVSVTRPESLSAAIGLGSRFAVPGLSVRSLWSAWLTTRPWQPNDEVLLSGVNIRDMARLIEVAGYSPVTVEVDQQTLSVRPEELEAAITPRTRAIMVAHLFGSRCEMAPIAAIAKRHQLPLVEDAAQAYCGDGYWGHPEVDVSLWSFGPIKTQTALGGGVAICRDAAMAEALWGEQHAWPVDTGGAFRRRIWRFARVHALSFRSMYTAYFAWLMLRGSNPDTSFSYSLRNFGSGELRARVQRRASAVQMQWMQERVSQPVSAWVKRRAELGSIIRDGLPYYVRVGEKARFESPWVLPVVSADPRGLCRYLQERGYDATRYTSNLQVLDRETGHGQSSLVQTHQWMDRLVYLPFHPALTRRSAERLGELVGEYEK